MSRNEGINCPPCNPAWLLDRAIYQDKFTQVKEYHTVADNRKGIFFMFSIVGKSLDFLILLLRTIGP